MVRKYKEKKQQVESTQAKRLRNKRYDRVYLHLGGILKKIALFSVNSHFHVWRNRFITKKHCPNKLKALLSGKIKAKYELDFLLKRDTPLLFSKSTNPNPQLVTLNEYFNKNETNRQRGIQETQFLVKLIKDCLPIIPHLCKKLFFGLKPLNEKRANYLNQMFINFELRQAFNTNKIPLSTQYSVERLLGNADIQAMKQRSNKLINQKESKNKWKDIEKEEKHIKFSSQGYEKKAVYQSNSKYLKAMEDKIIGMQVVKNTIEEYIGQFYSLNHKRVEEKERQRFWHNAIPEDVLLSQEQGSDEIKIEDKAEVMGKSEMPTEASLIESQDIEISYKKRNLQLTPIKKMNITLNPEEFYQYPQVEIDDEDIFYQNVSSYRNNKQDYLQISDLFKTNKNVRINVNQFQEELARPITHQSILRLYECGIASQSQFENNCQQQVMKINVENEEMMEGFFAQSIKEITEQFEKLSWCGDLSFML